jgi:hypothetical protein
MIVGAMSGKGGRYARTTHGSKHKMRDRKFMVMDQRMMVDGTLEDGQKYGINDQRYQNRE